jgi:spore germination protein YaaH
VQYGRRIPTEAIELLHQRVTQEMSSIKEKKQKIIDKAAREGATIGIAGLRQNLERVKAEYKGPDREQYNRQLDNFVMSLEAKYGSAIPIDEAAKLHDKLGEEIRETEH